MKEIDSNTDTLGDAIPTTLGRNVSEVSERWLTDYELIHNRRLNTNEVSSSQSLLGRRLGATLYGRRRVILDSLHGKRLEPKEEYRLKAVINDCLAAHELGGSEYLGHFSAYCHPRQAFPPHLLLQQELYEYTYLLEPLYQSREGRRIGAIVGARILDFFDSEWFAEMIALVSEKRRARAHLHGELGIPNNLAELITSYIQMIDSKKGDLSSYGTGLLAWARLSDRFGSRLDGLISQLRQNVLVEWRGFEVLPVANVITGNSDFMMETAELAGSGFIVFPDSYLLDLLADEKSDQKNGKVESKAEMLSYRAVSSENDPHINEFPELKAMVVGELWLALHSLLQVVWLSENTGEASIYIDRNARRICSTESQALAMELLRYRNKVLNCCSQTTSEVLKRNSLVNEFLRGSLSLREMKHRRALCNPLNGVHRRELSNLCQEFEDIRSNLRGYYKSNQSRIERQIRHPEDFFLKVL